MPALAPLIGTPDLVIVGEPTSMQVATGHKGKVALKVICHGTDGHSALAPHFSNAIHAAAEMVQRMRGLQTALENGPTDPAYSIAYDTVHIGRICGGRALNIVPSHAQLDMELRHLAQTSAQDILDQIDAIAADETDPAHTAIRRACGLAGTQDTLKVPFGTEAGFFAELGLPTVVIGPGDMATDGHQPDEGMDLSQLAACDAMMTRILLGLGHRQGM